LPAQIRVVQASLVGSILSNLLLVLGSAFFAGGVWSGRKEQHYNQVSASANTSLLLRECCTLCSEARTLCVLMSRHWPASYPLEPALRTVCTPL
jgi:Ca2+:H+ antiporter